MGGVGWFLILGVSKKSSSGMGWWFGFGSTWCLAACVDLYCRASHTGDAVRVGVAQNVGRLRCCGCYCLGSVANPSYSGTRSSVLRPGSADCIII
jgi:hypothetical protein